MQVTHQNQVLSEVTVAVSAEQFLNAANIATQMYAARLPAEFVAATLMLARKHRGVHELMVMWSEEEEDSNERAEIVVDLQELLEDAEALPQPPPAKPQHIGFGDVDEVVAKVVAAKTKLRAIIDKNGGISAVARQTGIPQPSLSRMLNSVSMPRRSTISKIASALRLDEAEIATEFMW